MAQQLGAADEAFDEIVDFLEHFTDLEDPRQRAKVIYPLDEVLLLCLLGVLAGCESWVEIAKYGEKKLGFLRRFRRFTGGTPSHDQLGDIFAVLDGAQFQHCFIAWAASLTGLGADVVAIDGKTLRRSYQEAGAKAPIPMISAWSVGQNLVLGQAKVADKSNEIVAIPKLLDLLTIKGATVTIDAMGCQRKIAAKIAAKIIDKGADYILACKGNQGALHGDVELFFTEQAARGFADAAVSRHETLEKSHGRIERRTVTATHDIAWLKERHDWPGLKSIVIVESVREIGIAPNAKIERETRFYIASPAANAETLGAAIRGHWSIENGLHWVMDMVFRDDECRIRKKNAPANFTTIKHMASNILRRAPGKDSLRGKRRIAAWDDDFLASIVAP